MSARDPQSPMHPDGAIAVLPGRVPPNASESTVDAAPAWTVLGLLRWTTQHFAARGIENPRLDAECLLAFALGCDRLRLYLDFEKPVEADERARFRDLVRRRASERRPVAQLVGEREFWSLRLVVTPDVLVPRPETEGVVTVALGLFPDRERDLRVLDLGTGSGAIALALATERPKARILATDLSPAALDVARANAERHGLADRVCFACGDGFAPAGEEGFDLVVSNPPYVAERDAGGLPPELDHEPRMALFGGDDGTDVLRRFVADAAERLRPGGAIVLECGPEQAGRVANWLGEAGFLNVRVHPDLAGRARVVAGRLSADEGLQIASGG